MLKKSAIWINRLLWTVLVTVLIIVATYVSLGRYYIDYVERYQQQLLDRLVNYSGLPLTADRLYGRWSKLSPVLTLQQLVLYSADSAREPVLTINDASIQFDVIDTILTGSVQLKSLLIDGVDGTLEEVSSGQWQLQGFSRDTAKTTNYDKIVEMILLVDRASVINAHMAMVFDRGSDALLSVQELSLQRKNQFRRLKIQATLDQGDKPLFAVIEARGDPRDLKSFSAQAYLKLDDVDFTAQLPALQALGVDLQHAQADGEIWVDWQPKSIISVQGDVTIPLLDLAAISGEQLLPLTDLQFNFLLEKNGKDTWSGWIPTLTATWHEQSVSFDHAQFSIDTEQLNLSLPHFDLAKTSQQLQAIKSLSAHSKELLHSLSPSGQLANLHLKVLLPDDHNTPAPAAVDQPERFVLRANLEEVALLSWKGAPGASGVSGYLQVSPRQGLVELDSHAVTLAFPNIYHQPLLFSTVQGQLAWHLVEDRVLVDSSPLYITADHGAATGLLDLDLPLDATAVEPPQMTLSIGLVDTDAAYRNRFIPYILNPGFLEWMKASVPSGHVIDGAFVYRGSLLKTDADNRTVQLYFNIDDTTLNYHQDWPPLTAIAGLVEINDTDVYVTTTEAKLFDLNVTTAKVSTAPLAKGGMWLTVAANAEGNAADALRVVNESVIHQMVGGVFENWQLTGKAKAAVQLGIPIAGSAGTAEIDVRVQLADSSLAIPDYNIEFSQLNGPLNYTSDKGVFSPKLVAKLYNKPVAVKVTSAQNKAVVVDINGRLAMQDVQQWSQQPALAFTRGETDFTAQVKVIRDGHSEFTVQSDLVGITIDLPAPYAKLPEQNQPFWLQLPIAEPMPLLKMGLSGQAELQLRLQQGSVASAMVVLGEANNIEHEQDFFVVSGSLPRFNLDQWQPILERYQQLDTDRPLTEPPAGVHRTLGIKVRDLAVVDFNGFNQHYENSIVSLQRQGQGWWLAATNDLLAGELLIPDKIELPWLVKLQRLALLERVLKEDNSSIDFDAIGDIKIDFSVEQLMLGNELYGRITFQLRGDNNGLRFNNISGELGGISVDKANPATLEWLHKEGGEQSRLYGDFAMSDVGDVLEKFNYERVVESKAGSGSIDLSWPGKPTQWQLAASTGPIHLKIKDGRFLKASDTATGTLKVVGIVNLTNIIRRLQLDFSDVYKSGVSFDKIEGELILENSLLTIIDDLKVDSPSSRFYLRGNADLLAKQLDMELIATLPVVNNLPWIIAIAGGLPTAAGVYVASKLFEDQFDRFASAVYSVKGDWNNPELKFERVFDDGKKNYNKLQQQQQQDTTADEAAQLNNP